MRSARSCSWLLVALVLLPLSVSCGGGGGGSPRSCLGDGECGALARCIDSACVGDAQPVAVVALPRAPEAFALVELDGSGSSDPDAAHGDRIDAFHWKIESLDHGCVPPAVAGTGAVARVRFGCAGSFRVELVVVDEMGKESDPASADVTVAAASKPGVSASPDRTVDHACSGTPLICTTEGGAVAVEASLSAGIEPSGPVAYHWSADAPRSGPLDEHRRVTFLPSPDVANPAVRIEVDEAAIAAMLDDWVLRVTARDEAGPLGEATARVSVLNRPPVLAEAVPSTAVDHTYSSGAYRATAPASRWQDPDGDPLAPAGTTGNGVCSSYSFRSDGTALVECAQAFDGEPDHLTGFATTHTVSLLARDPWQAAAAAQSTAVTIGNHPVSAASSTVTGSVSCGRGTSQDACCEWDAEPGIPRSCITREWHCAELDPRPPPALADPDGDPLRVTWLGGGFVAQTVVCEPGTCVGVATPPVAAYLGCTKPTGSRIGSFTASDGLSNASGTLTFSY